MTVFVGIDGENPPSPPIVSRRKQKREQWKKQQNMPPKKKASRAAQQHPQPAISDYETDNYTDNAHTLPVTAPPPERTTEELNLLVLKRWYPELENIIDIAPFAVLYQCHQETQQWEKCELQGSLFICQFSPPTSGAFPRYKVIILNRKGMDNFELDLTSTETIEVTEHFIMCSIMDEDSKVPRVYGIWMFSEESNPETCQTKERIINTILELAQRAEQFAQVYEEEPSYEETYESGADDALYAQAQVEVPVQQEQGQRIDLAALFAKPTHPQPVQEQPPAHSAQQNALLGLFKSASKG